MTVRDLMKRLNGRVHPPFKRFIRIPLIHQAGVSKKFYIHL
jgi:hypothetical protein